MFACRGKRETETEGVGSVRFEPGLELTGMLERRIWKRIGSDLNTNIIIIMEMHQRLKYAYIGDGGWSIIEFELLRWRVGSHPC